MWGNGSKVFLFTKIKLRYENASEGKKFRTVQTKPLALNLICDQCLFVISVHKKKVFIGGFFENPPRGKKKTIII